MKSRTPRMIPAAASATGFTLIEVLIALLILAIGVLGIAALQFKGLRYSHDANLRSQINFLAWDIADRMRLNRANAADYETATHTADPTHNHNCDPEATGAADDIDCWLDQVETVLPAGSQASIAGPTDSRYTVQLSWTDREGEPHVVEYTFQP